MANEVVKYNNKFNQVVFQNFTENELSLLMAICSKLKGKGTDTITLTFDQIKVLTNEKQHYTVQGYAEMIDAMYRKLINLAYYYNDGKDVAGAFHLFQGYERSISDKEVQIAVTPQFLHLFNAETVAQASQKKQLLGSQVVSQLICSYLPVLLIYSFCIQ